MRTYGICGVLRGPGNSGAVTQVTSALSRLNVLTLRLILDAWQRNLSHPEGQDCAR
jgi:hypothetical protein